MIRLGETKLVLGVRTSLTAFRTYASHYDILGVTPKSTQNEIKTAYYKLSKLYHPDTSTDEATAKQFRDITEAYEVLGNVKLKKMYDRGLLGSSSRSPRITREADPEPTDPAEKFYKSRTHRNIVPTMDGKTPIYNFDTWAKNHYSSLYHKSQYNKDFIKKKEEKQADAAVAHRHELTMFFVMILGTSLFVLAINGVTDYDRNHLPAANSDIKLQNDKT